MESRNDTPVEEILVAEDPEESQRNRSLFAGVALAVIVLLVIWWILSQLVVVPDVVGMQERDARATIEETGLEISEVFRLPSAADPAASRPARRYWACPPRRTSDGSVGARQRTAGPVLILSCASYPTVAAARSSADIAASRSTSATSSPSPSATRVPYSACAL